MYYIYPKLSEKDCLIFRLGGAGFRSIRETASLSRRILRC